MDTPTSSISREEENSSMTDDEVDEAEMQAVLALLKPRLSPSSTSSSPVNSSHSLFSSMDEDSMQNSPEGVELPHLLGKGNQSFARQFIRVMLDAGLSQDEDDEQEQDAGGYQLLAQEQKPHRSAYQSKERVHQQEKRSQHARARKSLKRKRRTRSERHEEVNLLQPLVLTHSSHASSTAVGEEEAISTWQFTLIHEEGPLTRARKRRKLSPPLSTPKPRNFTELPIASGSQHAEDAAVHDAVTTRRSEESEESSLALPQSSAASSSIDTDVADDVVLPPALLPEAQETELMEVDSCSTSDSTSSTHASGNEGRPYKCSFKGCGASFALKSNLTVHNRIHTGEKPYKCSYDGCNAVFRHKSSLNQHLKTHTGERPHKCNHEGCNAAFIQKHHLTIHYRTHTGDRPFKCTHPGCQSTFVAKSALVSHIRTHGREAVSLESPNAKTTRTRKRSRSDVGNDGLHQCTHDGCPCEFNTNNELLAHLNTHNARKFYKCQHPNCNASFTIKSGLTIHERTHTGTRPFQCSHEGCNASFSAKSALTKHMKRHQQL